MMPWHAQLRHTECVVLLGPIWRFREAGGIMEDSTKMATDGDGKTLPKWVTRPGKRTKNDGKIHHFQYR